MRVEKTTHTVEATIERYYCTEEGCTFSTLSEYAAKQHEVGSHTFDQEITFGEDDEVFLHFPSAEHYAKYVRRYVGSPCPYPYSKDGWFVLRYSDDYGYSTSDILSVIDDKHKTASRILKEANEMEERFLTKSGTPLASSHNHGLPQDSKPLQEP